MHLALHPPSLSLLSMLLPLGLLISLHICESLRPASNGRTVPEAAVVDLLVLLEEAAFALSCFSRMVGSLMLVGFLLMARSGE